MKGSFRDQTRSRNATSVYNRKFDSLLDGVLYVLLRARQYLKYEFIVELASRYSNLGMSL
jgi:hypothetical protein